MFPSSPFWSLMEALESGCLGLAFDFVTKGEGECGIRKD